MSEVERTFGVGAEPGLMSVDDFRRDAIGRIAAWSIDHPREKLDYAQVFPRQFQMLRDAYFEQRRKLVKKTLEDLLALLAEERIVGVDLEARERVERTRQNLELRGYCERCAREAVSYLLRKRYA
jgi:predicted Ser/Thr protein kinase